MLQQEVRTIDNSRPLRPRSRSFKVIDFCCNRKPIYDFLLMINCHLSSVSNRFRDTASRNRKPLSHPTLRPQIKGPLDARGRINHVGRTMYILNITSSISRSSKSLAAGASPQTPLGCWQHSPAEFKGPTYKTPASNGRKGKGKRGKGKGRGPKMIYAPGAKNPRAATGNWLNTKTV